MKNIATALVKAQKEFAPALKTATNPHFRSKYVDFKRQRHIPIPDHIRTPRRHCLRD